MLLIGTLPMFSQKSREARNQADPLREVLGSKQGMDDNAYPAPG